MAFRSVGSVVIRLGIMSIGVKLYLAAKGEDVQMKEISPKKNRCNHLVVDSVTREELQRNSLLHGYEVSKDQIVIFTNEELTSLHAGKQDSMDISEVVPLDTVDLLFVEKSHYLNPDKGMELHYALLFEALKKSGKVAVAKYYTRRKEHLVIIRPYKHGLVMHQMFYKNEIRSFDENNSPALDAESVDMGVQMLAKLTKPAYDVSKYSDEFITKLNNAVQVKLEGGTIAVPGIGNVPMVASGPSAADRLKAQLRASLGLDSAPAAAPVLPEAKPEKKVGKKANKK